MQQPESKRKLRKWKLDKETTKFFENFGKIKNKLTTAVWDIAEGLARGRGYIFLSELVETAKKFNGIPYLWGGSSSKAIDCSGFSSII